MLNKKAENSSSNQPKSNFKKVRIDLNI